MWSTCLRPHAYFPLSPNPHHHKIGASLRAAQLNELRWKRLHEQRENELQALRLLLHDAQWQKQAAVERVGDYKQELVETRKENQLHEQHVQDLKVHVIQVEGALRDKEQALKRLNDEATYHRQCYEAESKVVNQLQAEVGGLQSTLRGIEATDLAAKWKSMAMGPSDTTKPQIQTQMDELYARLNHLRSQRVPTAQTVKDEHALLAELNALSVHQDTLRKKSTLGSGIERNWEYFT